MPLTRTQTGHITRRHYDALTLQLESIKISPGPESPTPTRSSFRRSGLLSPTKVTKSAKQTTRKGSLTEKSILHRRKNSAAKKQNSRVPPISNQSPSVSGSVTPIPDTQVSASQSRVQPSLEESTQLGLSDDEKERLERYKELSNPEPIVFIPDLLGPKATFPSIAFGEKQTVGLSIIGRADKEVQVWEEILNFHEKDHPSLAPICRMSLEKARAKRAALEETEDNLRVGIANAAQTAIKNRLDELQWALETSKFEPEKENILGAITAYKEGKIHFSEQYTVIWAGKVVDTAKDYGELCNNREERLDKYAALHGPHWLWWEPPLKQHPEARVRQSASATLVRLNAASKMGQWHVKQGYQKRAGFVSRMVEIKNDTQPSPTEFLVQRDEQGNVFAGQVGPRLAYRSLLDSGATFPSLHQNDFEQLGIDPYFYACQSVVTLNTANGSRLSRVIEMVVTVLDDDGKQLVDPADSVYPPQFAAYLGGLCPVVECFEPLTWDAFGFEISNRLSGILPFLACYNSYAPTTEKFHLGEDRRDVLGGHKMPGQRKWNIGLPYMLFKPPLNLQETDYGLPVTTFSHRGSLLVNADDTVNPHGSITTIFPGTAKEQSHRVNPRIDWAVFQAKEQEELERERRKEEHAVIVEEARKKLVEEQIRRMAGGGVGVQVPGVGLSAAGGGSSASGSFNPQGPRLGGGLGGAQVPPGGNGSSVELIEGFHLLGREWWKALGKTGGRDINAGGGDGSGGGGQQQQQQ